MFKRFSTYLFSAILPVIGTVSVAEAQPPVPGATSPDLFYAGLKMAAALALVLGGLLLTLYLMRRFGLGRAARIGGQEAIRVIATKALGPKKYITLVEVGGSVLTLGVTEDRITRLDKTPAEEFRSTLPAMPEGPTESGFMQRLRALSDNPAPAVEVDKQ